MSIPGGPGGRTLDSDVITKVFLIFICILIFELTLFIELSSIQKKIGKKMLPVRSAVSAHNYAHKMKIRSEIMREKGNKICSKYSNIEHTLILCWLMLQRNEGAKPNTYEQTQCA